MYYLLLYDVVDQFAERRTPHRSAHLKLARAAADNSELLLGGAFADPLDGAALVFKAADQSVCRAIRDEQHLSLWSAVRMGILRAERVHYRRRELSGTGRKGPAPAMDAPGR